MNMETVYAILIDTGWFFLAGWTLLLLVASAVVFWDESPKHVLHLARTPAPVFCLPAGSPTAKPQKRQSVATRG